MKISKTTSLTTKVSILSISCALIGGTSAYAGKLPADVPEYPSYPRIMVLGKAKASKEVEKAKQEAQKKKEEDAKKAQEAEDAAKAAQQKKIEADKLADQARREIEAEKNRLEAQMRKEEQSRKAAEAAAKAIAAEEARVAAQVEQARQELEARKRDEAIKAAEAEKARLAEEARRLAAAEAEKARLAAEKQKAADARAAEAARLEAEARRAVSRDPVQKTAVKQKNNTVRSSTVVKKTTATRRSSTYRKSSGVSTVSKGSTDQAKQVALHDHYAKWVSSYVGGHIGRSSTADQGGVEVGVFGGRNWKSDKIVYGIEGGVSKSNSSGSFAQNGSYDAGWSATVRVRGGYLVTPDTLLYATAGVAWTNFDINAGGREVSDTYAGFVIGAGLEHQFNDNWSARAEYTYTDYGSTTYQHNGQAYTFDPETHAFRVAVVYKF